MYYRFFIKKNKKIKKLFTTRINFKISNLFIVIIIYKNFYTCNISRYI